MPRAAKVCGQPGCPAILTDGDSRCPTHKRPAWEGRSGVNATPAHKRWRKQVMVINDGRCVRCGKQATDADHTVPQSVAPELAFDPDNGQPLCATCHQAKTIADRTKYGASTPHPPPGRTASGQATRSADP